MMFFLSVVLFLFVMFMMLFFHFFFYFYFYFYFNSSSIAFLYSSNENMPFIFKSLINIVGVTLTLAFLPSFVSFLTSFLYFSESKQELNLSISRFIFCA